MRTTLVALLAAGSGCTPMYHVNVGPIDNTVTGAERFEIVLGSISVDEAGMAMQIGQDAISDVTSYFSMGPRTGLPTRDPNFASPMIDQLYAACPSGRITGLLAMREADNWGFVSRERVRISGYCLPEPPKPPPVEVTP